MTRIRITKIFEFEMAHALHGYDGPCRNIHGHSYKLHVTVAGTPVVEDDHPCKGMVMDFGELKKIINRLIIDGLDHALLLTRNTPQEHLATTLGDHGLGLKVAYTDHPSTCETMLADFARTIKGHLPAQVQLHSLKLYETSSSYAEWHACDNQ